MELVLTLLRDGAGGLPVEFQRPVAANRSEFTLADQGQLNHLIIAAKLNNIKQLS